MGRIFTDAVAVPKDTYERKAEALAVDAGLAERQERMDGIRSEMTNALNSLIDAVGSKSPAKGLLGCWACKWMDKETYAHITAIQTALSGFAAGKEMSYEGFRSLSDNAGVSDHISGITQIHKYLQTLESTFKSYDSDLNKAAALGAGQSVKAIREWRAVVKNIAADMFAVFMEDLQHLADHSANLSLTEAVTDSCTKRAIGYKTFVDNLNTELNWNPLELK